MSQRQRFQGLCFEGLEGRFLMHFFDLMPYHMRELLRYCPYNLCVVCVRRYGITPEQMADMIREQIPVEHRQLRPKGKNRLLNSRLGGRKKVAR